MTDEVQFDFKVALKGFYHFICCNLFDAKSFVLFIYWPLFTIY